MRVLLATAFAVLSIAIFFITRAPAEDPTPGLMSVEGPVVEITPNDITIKTAERERDWFRLPGNGRVFAADGKTRYPREALHPGLRIRIFYDWRALTYVRVAHHVIVLTPSIKTLIHETSDSRDRSHR